MKENQRGQNREIVVVLPDIRSVLNVGSIFRTSDAIGVSKIYLCGYTPSPVDRFGRERSDLHKAALGSEKTVKWEHKADTLGVIDQLKKEGYLIIAVEQSKKSIDYKEVKLSNKTAFIFGNEVSGVDKKVLKKCDFIAEIPMVGEKESLNVSVSFGVVMYRFLDR